MRAAAQEATDAFVEEARLVTVAEAVERLGVTGLSRAGASGEAVGPCPACGGTDRFSINAKRNVWNCRGSDGGADGISLAAHLSGFDVRRREGFLAACAAALGRPLPEEAEAETAEDRAQREARLEARKARAAERRAADDRAAADFRDRERARARGKWEGGTALDGPEGSPVRRYLALRLGGQALPVLPFVRAIAAEPYWATVGKGEALAFAGGGIDAATVWQDVPGDGRPHAIHEGPAMVTPFVDAEGHVVGCHLTWIDLNGTKGRPLIWLRTTKSDGTGTIARAATKKMRGTKKGGLIPLVGFVMVNGRIVPEPGRTRLVIGEGIENVVAVAIAEAGVPASGLPLKGGADNHFRDDTLYAAAGDLGNLAGPADPASAFGHPELKDRGGRRALRVQGPVPRPDQAPGDAVAVPGQVSEILLVADGDSEIWATASAMLRAERRLGGETRIVMTAWPPRGMDFADLLTGVEIMEAPR